MKQNYWKLLCVLLFIVFFTTNVYSQTRNDNLSKEQLIKNNAIAKHQVDSLKNVLKNLDKNLKTHLRVLYTLKYGKKNGDRIAQGKIWKGMTPKMMQDSWGKPDSLNKNVEKWGIFIQYYYGDITYFFKKGKLTNWEETAKKK